MATYNEYDGFDEQTVLEDALNDWLANNSQIDIEVTQITSDTIRFTIDFVNFGYVVDWNALNSDMWVLDVGPYGISATELYPVIQCAVEMEDGLNATLGLHKQI